MYYLSLISGFISVCALLYVFLFPPKTMFTDKYGVPHFTPQVIHPETGELLTIGQLIKHFKGQ